MLQNPMDQAAEDARVELAGELDQMNARDLVKWIMRWKQLAGYKRICKMLAEEVAKLEAIEAQRAAGK